MNIIVLEISVTTFIIKAIVYYVKWNYFRYVGTYALYDCSRNSIILLMVILQHMHIQQKLYNSGVVVLIYLILHFIFF